MPIQQRSITGKVDPIVEQLLRDLLAGVNRLEPELGSAPRITQLTAALSSAQQALSLAQREINILKQQVGTGQGDISVDPNGALNDNPLAVRVDGASVIINGSNQLEAPAAAGGITQLTGDGIAGPGSGSQAFTLANTAVTPGTYGDATNVGQFTVDSKGRITAASDVAITGDSFEWVLADSWTHSGDVSEVDFTGLGIYASLLVIVRGVTKSVSGNTALVVSTDNGSTFFTTSGDYVIVADTGIETNAATCGLISASATAARSGVARIINSGATGGPKEISLASRGQINLFVADTDPIDAIRIFNPSGGNLTGGTIYVFGA